MHSYAREERAGELFERLLAVWEDAVRATHHFLSENDIESIRPMVRRGLAEIPILIVMPGGGEPPVAFMGIYRNRIEMLFVSPEARGRGLGRELVMHALCEHGADKLDVNEDNRQGVGFYRRLGFEIVGRSPEDGQGNPFPLLHMEYRGIHESGAKNN